MPTKPASERRSELLKVRLQPDLKAAVEETARALHLTPSEFTRAALLEALARAPKASKRPKR